MMVAILSDIHANLAALKAVLTDAEQHGVSEAWFLGDLVVYGPDPLECIGLLRSYSDPGKKGLRLTRMLRGNNDEAVLNAVAGKEVGTSYTLLETLNGGDGQKAAGAGAVEYSHAWTVAILKAAPAERDFLEKLAGLPIEDDSGKWLLLHANPCDPIGEMGSYIYSEADAEEAFICLERKPAICFFGHTHAQCVFERIEPQRLYANAMQYSWQSLRDRAAALELSGTSGSEVKGERTLWLVNPGSVGQPRDGDARACYALFDTEARSVTMRRVTYDVGETVAALGAKMKFEQIGAVGGDYNEASLGVAVRTLQERLKSGGLT